jgi:hypothetical protein
MEEYSVEALLNEIWTSDPEFLREIEQADEAMMARAFALSDEELTKGYRVPVKDIK